MTDPARWTVPRPPLLSGFFRRIAPRSFRGQIVVSTMLLMTVVMIFVGVGVQVLLGITARRDVDRVLEDRADAVIAVARTDSSLDDSLDPGVRVYDGAGDLVAGSMERSARAVANDLATTDVARNKNVGENLRLRAVPFTTDAGERRVVVVSQATTPYERSEMYALAATVGIGVLVVGLTGVIASRVTTQALAPVAQMAERATDWSEHDLTHRFEVDPSDNELAQLAGTLDGLLERVAMAIRAEQRLTSELAHELRTPLTAIQGAADLSLMRGVGDAEVRLELEQIAASARAMSEVITTLVDVARDRASAGAATCRVADVVEDVSAMVRPGLTFVADTAGSVARVAAPRQLVVRALAPVVDNAVDHGRTTVTLTAVDTSRAVEISVHDDGPGLDPVVADELFEVGASARGSTGLGLAIAQRVARSMGGSVRVGNGGDGATFVVTLPRA